MGWLPGTLRALDAAQRALLDALAALGLTGMLHGQPAWPWAHRLALETLAIDRASARSLLLATALLLLALAAALLALASRRVRRAAVVVGLTALLFLPTLPAGVLLAPALPTSFHRPDPPFSVASIVQGEALYRRHCTACHGEEGGGDGPLAGTGGTWPPDLGGALLWRRLDGELFWRVMHGLHDRRGRPSMPGFADRLGAHEVWALLDYLQAQAAGRTLRDRGRWEQPLRLPDAALSCDDGAAPTLRARVGQRLRIVAVAGGAVREDPRFVTVALVPAGAAVHAGCHIDGRDAWPAFARLAGLRVDQLAGTQFLVDREGWLRARSPPGQEGWREADLVCRIGPDEPPVMPGAAAVGLDRLIARMDAEPVRALKGGVPH